MSSLKINENKNLFISDEKEYEEENINSLNNFPESFNINLNPYPQIFNIEVDENEDIENINSIHELQCIYFLNGCPFKTKLGKSLYDVHIRDCKFGVKTCCKCNEPIFIKDEKEHDDNKCPKTKLKCIKCEETFLREKNHKCSNQIYNKINKKEFNEIKQSEEINNDEKVIYEFEKISSIEKLIKTIDNNQSNIKDFIITEEKNQKSEKIKIQVRRDDKQGINFTSNKRKRSVKKNYKNYKNFKKEKWLKKSKIENSIDNYNLKNNNLNEKIYIFMIIKCQKKLKYKSSAINKQVNDYNNNNNSINERKKFNYNENKNRKINKKIITDDYEDDENIRKFEALSNSQEKIKKDLFRKIDNDLKFYEDNYFSYKNNEKELANKNEFLFENKLDRYLNSLINNRIMDKKNLEKEKNNKFENCAKNHFDMRYLNNSSDIQCVQKTNNKNSDFNSISINSTIISDKDNNLEQTFESFNVNSILNNAEANNDIFKTNLNYSNNSSLDKTMIDTTIKRIKSKIFFSKNKISNSNKNNLFSNHSKKEKHPENTYSNTVNNLKGTKDNQLKDYKDIVNRKAYSQPDYYVKSINNQNNSKYKNSYLLQTQNRTKKINKKPNGNYYHNIRKHFKNISKNIFHKTKKQQKEMEIANFKKYVESNKDF